MNRHFEAGIVFGFASLLILAILSVAVPPEPPITVKGFVFNFAGGQMGIGINVSINNTNISTLPLIATQTSGPNSTTTGFYQADINGSNGNVMKVVAFNRTEYGFDNSTASNNVIHLNITINDTRIMEPIPFSPSNKSLITTRAPLFIWNNSFDRVNNTGMARNYTLQIANYYSFTQEFADPPLFLFTVDGINETPIQTNHTLTFDLQPGTWYWRVQANQINTSAFSKFSMIFNFTIVATTACSLPTSIVDFGVLALNRSNDTTDNTPRPMVIQNSGNLPTNVSINASHLWNNSNAQNPSVFYQWKITDNATNSFDAANTTTFLNMPLAPRQQTITNLHYTNGSFANPAARVEINITAHAQEPPGNKRSDILLTCEG